MPTAKQTAYLRLTRDFPGITIQQLAKAFNERWHARTGQETDKNAYQCVAKMRSAGWIRAGEPSLGRGLGHHLTETGVALAGLDAIPPGSPPVYSGSPKPTRFVDGLGAPAMVGPVVDVHEQTRQAYAEATAPKRGDLVIHNIRMALQDARRAHEKIVDSRGGPQVLVDIRAAATIRALELITDRLAKAAP